MNLDANLVASVVLNQFNILPRKRRPQIRSNGVREWVPLSGIIAEQDGVLHCLALA
jgi:tRNA-specific adenosine deaminase 1